MFNVVQIQISTHPLVFPRMVYRLELREFHISVGKECLTQSHPWSLIHELFHFLILLHLLVLFLVILHPSGNIQMLSHTFLWGFDCTCSSSTGSWNLHKDEQQTNVPSIALLSGSASSAGLKSRYQQGWFLLEALGENPLSCSFQLLEAAGISWFLATSLQKFWRFKLLNLW